MARRRSRRLIKPLLPGIWTLLAVLLFIGSVWGLFWFGGRSLRVLPPAAAKSTK